MEPSLQLIVSAFMDNILEQELERKILVGVSGGVDSMVLMHLLNDYCRSRGCTLGVAHVNHKLRHSADNDEEIVRQACIQMGVSFFSTHLDELSSEKTEAGIEEKARTLRYRALFEAAKDFGTTLIVLAHHGDDQVETFLWRFVRGTSTSGLAGIRPVAKRNGFMLLRPLLTVSKANILEFAQEKQIQYGYDETNNDIKYTRNYLRHQVIPNLKQIQPDLTQVTRRVTKILREEDAFLEQMAQEVIEKTVEKHHDVCRFSITEWKTIALPLQRRAIHILLYCFASAEYGYSHVDSVLQLISNSHPSATVSLPEGISAWREYDFMCIGRRLVKPECAHQKIWELEKESVLTFGTTDDEANWTFICTPWVNGCPVKTNTMLELHIPAHQTLIIKTANTSIRMQPLGLRGTKKVQDIFTDKKIPKPLRTSWPAMYLNNELIWLPGLARSEFERLDEFSESGWRILATPPIGIREIIGHVDCRHDVNYT